MIHKDMEKEREAGGSLLYRGYPEMTSQEKTSELMSKDGKKTDPWKRGRGMTANGENGHCKGRWILR